MEEKLVNILNEMAEYLNISQLKKLQEVLLKQLSDKSPQKEPAANADYLKLFLDASCDAILAVGGGSAMDVAKCIKLFAAMDHTRLYLGQPYEENDILLAAIPTTAGTGSESTRHAVIYYKGEKQS